ncbi:hypothetical protein FF38_06039 [Lucilia cuprina]|uniref:Uncharacterized protein n=1 Tax=Lucilia cuprina TaxID=7375 RepID=A0A0L0BXM0_LUCCU|nr:hypothetical protein FF38_06039 [Lucilia cuprina]
MQPSFVNVLNVYSFCNWHDVSWGTKGSDTVTALPAVTAVKEGGHAIVEEAVLDLADIDKRFQQVVKRALEPYKSKKTKSKTTVEDQSKMFRTYLVVTWLVSNVILIWAITSTDSQSVGMNVSVRERIAYFFATLLWANAVVAIVRIIGCVLFLIATFFRRVAATKFAKLEKLNLDRRLCYLEITKVRHTHHHIEFHPNT